MVVGANVDEFLLTPPGTKTDRIGYWYDPQHSFISSFYFVVTSRCFISVCFVVKAQNLSHHTASNCDNSHSACSERGLPAGGINIVGSMLHMHTIGVGMKTQLVRANGTEMPLIDDDQHYDFNLQTYEAIEPVQMYPGDQLITTCTYDGTGRAERTLGGEGTDAEMCLVRQICFFEFVF